MADFQARHDLIEDELADSMKKLNVKENPLIEAYCHGSAPGNDSEDVHGGIACYFPKEHNELVAKPLAREDDSPKVTNMRAQSLAAQLAISLANDMDPKKARELVIYTNDEVLVRSMTEYYLKWELRGWIGSKKKPVENQDILRPLVEETRKRKIHWKYVQKEKKMTERDGHLSEAMHASRAASIITASP